MEGKLSLLSQKIIPRRCCNRATLFREVKSLEIEHLKNARLKNKLITKKNSEELCKLVKVMLEYKKPE